MTRRVAIAPLLLLSGLVLPSFAQEDPSSVSAEAQG